MKTIILAIYIGMCTQLSAQIPAHGVDEILATQDSLMPDSVVIQYFNLDHIDRYLPYVDSSRQENFHNYDPARKQDVDYIHLGNQGSAASPLKYSARPYIGFHEGHVQYDLYRLELQDFKFYEGNAPLVNVRFSPMGSQENFVVQADFTRSYADGVTVSANFQRIFQTGLYKEQQTKLTNFGVSIKYAHSGERYTGFLSMISNVAQEQNNGGPRDLEDFVKYSAGNRELINTKITGAVTRHQQKYYSLLNYYKLNSKNSNLDLLLRYDVGLDLRYYKFSDPDFNNINDPDFYSDLNIDFRGIRNLTRVNRLNNAFYTYLTNKDRLDVRVGIVYDHYTIEQDIVESSYDNVYLDFDGTIPFLKNLSLLTEAQLGIGDGAGDFNIDAALDINIGNLGALRGGASFYRYTPSLLYRSLYLSQVNVWSNPDFVKPIGSDIYGILSIPKLNITAEIHQHLVNNALYFDDTAKPVQHEEIYATTTFTLQNSLHLGICHLENSFLLQLMNENIYGLPTYWSKHNFYLEFPMFKGNLLSKWGVETRLTPDYDGLAYNPAIGTFHQKIGEQTIFYPTTDVYFTGKIKKFKIFVKLQNLNQLIDKNKIDFRIFNHPQQDWSIRFGIGWLFFG